MSQSQSSRGGPLAKLQARRNKGLTSASSTSLNSTAEDHEDVAGRSAENVPESNRLRDSIDAAIDKVKDRTSRRASLGDVFNADYRRSSDEPVGRRLSTLVSKTKRRIKRDRDDDLDRSLSVDYTGAINGNQSDLSLSLGGSGRSSLFTDDERSDTDNKPVRPNLSPRQSHAGYLTYSSPELNAQTIPIDAASEPAHSPEAVPNIPQILVPFSTTETLSAPSVPARSPSPGDKLRGKFALSRKKSGDSTASGKSVGGGGGSAPSAGGLSGLFKSSSRRNSTAEQLSTDTPQVEPAPPPAALKEQPSSTLGLRQNRPETPQNRGRPVINSSLPATPPNLLNAPSTLVTPPTPTDVQNPTFLPPSPTKSTPAARTLNSVESIRHRRAQSANLPSKLSTSVNAPLTPTVEEAKTPGGTLTQPAPAENSNSFFSSFFSAATKAAGSVGSGISTISLPSQKSKAVGTPQPVDVAAGGEEVIPGPESRPGTAPAEGQQKPLAVETIGKGDLSFSHLGISDSMPNLMASAIEAPSMLHLDGQEMSIGQDRKMEEEAAARAVSSAYEKPIAAVVSQATGSTRPMSIASNERLTLGEQTPPRSGGDAENNKDLKRSGSVRSKLSGRRKHRGSSATVGTSNSIAAALKDSSTGMANPGAHGVGHRLTGFAVASSKRNKEFHQMFRSVPEDDFLIEDYSAALQRDILLHGRLYVSEGHICFSSNILGWVTNLVISFDEVVSIEKKSTAMIFPNAIVISTLQARNTFASFVARDSTYDLLIGIWKISHPNLKSSVNGVMLNTPGTGDKTEVAEIREGDEGSTDESEDEVYDEDADTDAGSFTDGGVAASEVGSTIGDPTLSRKTSGIPIAAMPQSNGTAPKGLESADAVVTGAAVSNEFQGPTTHEPTECTESFEHYDRPLTDTTIPAPLGKVYGLMFGPASGAFMKKWLVDDQKSRDLNYEDDKTGLDNDHKSFTFDYIKPLNAPVGPRQTKCITTNNLKAFNLERSISVDCSTTTPDVPSGGSFTTRTRYCLMWGPNNSTRIIASCTIEWTAKSWLKGAIEKGANDGQIDYVKSIVAALKAAVTSKAPVKGQPRKGKRKGKREVFDAEEAIAQRESFITSPASNTASWGLLEPLRPVLDPVLAILRPFITSEVIIAILFLLLAYTWFFPSRGAAGVGYHGYTAPERIAAYEAIWRKEESALWDWLEDRAGLEGVYSPQVAKGAGERQKVLKAMEAGRRLQSESLNEREMDDAIRTTEAKLAALKEAVRRQKDRRTKS